MERRYRALRTIANIYRVIGLYRGSVDHSGHPGNLRTVSYRWRRAPIGFSGLDLGINSRASGIAGSIFGGLIVSLIVLIYGGVVAISLIAFGEGIYLLIAVEENTRKTALLLQNQPKVTPPVAQAQIPAA